mmetsp:Transcript_99120/g.212376  ORF Transcript_99120/g.212376 Transcript_99120/m.212376 type:complete len:206 (-) Transcript_99120:561-1178(-)
MQRLGRLEQGHLRCLGGDTRFDERQRQQPLHLRRPGRSGRPRLRRAFQSAERHLGGFAADDASSVRGCCSGDRGTSLCLRWPSAPHGGQVGSGTIRSRSWCMEGVAAGVAGVGHLRGCRSRRAHPPLWRLRPRRFAAKRPPRHVSSHRGGGHPPDVGAAEGSVRLCMHSGPDLPLWWFERGGLRNGQSRVFRHRHGCTDGHPGDA